MDRPCTLALVVKLAGRCLLILVIYLWVVGKMPEINRVFMYHGAEHKTINAFEASRSIDPESGSTADHATPAAAHLSC